MRVPLLAGTSVVLADVPEEIVVLRPLAPGDALGDVAAAVRDALRFPLAGPALHEVAPRGGRATVVVEPPTLPIPGSAFDPREAAVAAAVAELDAAGIRESSQTVLVASGLARRPLGRDLASLFSFEFRRRFRGRVEVHDVEAEDLAELPADGGTPPPRVHRVLADTDLVVTVGAAETVLHGGPAAFVGAAAADTLRGAQADSLLETAASGGWRAGLAIERSLATRAPVLGVSLALNHPRLAGTLQGYPFDPDADARVARSPLRRLFAAVPGALRARLLHTLRIELTANAAFAGPPSVAHAEALLRAIEARSASLPGPLDALVVPVPETTPTLPRESPNPLQAAYLALGLALRLWRDAFPVRDGGTVILVNPFRRRFAHPTQSPYRAFFAAARAGRDPEELAAAETAVADDERALEGYRAGRTCHPLLPFAEWAACEPALGRLGSVLVAECRDAAAARQLGLVPVHTLTAAVEMAMARSGGEGRVGVLLCPPYFPLVVGAPA
ncbi:MAG TPA: lactate racemase domain-containing protein [Gaiellaceae bacterium]|nr:lactate racemase domain-containing protein [Gaiellaceae bacterium]